VSLLGLCGSNLLEPQLGIAVRRSEGCGPQTFLRGPKMRPMLDAPFDGVEQTIRAAEAWCLDGPLGLAARAKPAGVGARSSP
jgi:hypothetical protein